MKPEWVRFKSGEKITFIPGLKNKCAHCRMKRRGVAALGLDIVIHGKPYYVLICESCLSEHAPQALAQLRMGMEA